MSRQVPVIIEGSDPNSLPLPVKNLPTLLLTTVTGIASGLVYTGTQTVSKLVGQNSSSSTAYLMLFDSITLPANGTSPKAVLLVGYGITAFPTENERTFYPKYINFTNGIYYAWSSTPATLTLVASGTGLTSEVYN